MPVNINFLSSVLPGLPWTVCKQLDQLLWATQAERNKINTASNNKRISSFHFSSCPIYIVLGFINLHLSPRYSTIFYHGPPGSLQEVTPPQYFKECSRSQYSYSVSMGRVIVLVKTLKTNCSLEDDICY